MRGFLTALQFLTIVPVRPGGGVSEAEVSQSAVYFPVVGVFQGVLLVFAQFIFGAYLHPDMAAALVLLFLVVQNGGFHLDGLADTFDGLAAGGDRPKRLAAMKDPSTGPAGVAAIVFVLGLKYLAIKTAASNTYFVFYSALLLMPVVSKWAMLVCMLAGTPARGDGLGRMFVEGLGRSGFALATLIAVSASSLPVIFAPDSPGPVGHLVNLGVFFSAGAFCLFLVRIFKRRFGGLTGDTLGAAGELVEVLFISTVGLWQRFYAS